VILIADDEAIIRDIIKRKITAATDFSVLEAEDGLDALEKLKAEKIDLVITDIKMPRMTGIELLSEIRRTGLDTPVIIITGYGTLNDAIEALRLGALNFIKKPFHTNELLSVIDRVFTVYEEKVFLKDILPFVQSQTAHLLLPNDHSLFQGAISYVNELIKTCWTEYVSGAVDAKICLYEALLNAFEHGNLEITSQEKEAVLDRDQSSYEQFLSDRVNQEPYCYRGIDLKVQIDTEKAVITITDEGPGFDVKSLPDPTDPENIMRNLGRGILLITSIMSDVQFNESGNAVTMTMNRRRE
jgi:DNA-binding response OmpR family regulator